MQIDSAILYVYIRQLNKNIQSAIVRQIHQIDDRSYDFELYSINGQPGHLIFNTYTPPLFYYTEKLPPNLEYEPSQTFCMTLRKYLEGARLSKIEQISLDRVVKFTFDRIETEGKIISRDIYAELIPSAPNLILVENGVIMDACLKGKRGGRLIAAKENYQFESNTNRLNFLLFSPQEMQQILDFGKNKSYSVKDWIYQTFNGFSTTLLRELCRRADVSPDDYIYRLDMDHQHKIVEAMEEISHELKKAETIRLYTDEKGRTVASPIKLTDEKQIEEISPLTFMSREANHIENALKPMINDLTRQIHEAIKKEDRKQKKIQMDLKETDKIDEYKLYGNLLSIYPYLKPGRENRITVDNLFAAPPVKVTIPINPELTITQNSQNYFKKYNKMKTRLQVGKEKLEESLQKSKYLEEMLYFTGQAETKEDLNEIKEELHSLGIKKQSNQARNRKNKSKAREIQVQHVKIDGFTVYIGKNNTQNEYLTLHKAHKYDIWLHVKKLPGSHVVISSDHQEVPFSTIEKAARLAAENSKAKYSGNVEVDYTFIKNVKKIPQGPPGLVNYTHQKTIVVHL